MIRPRRKKIEHHVHYYVLKTATDLCLASYEGVMHNNSIREEWLRTHPGFSEKHLQLAFVKRHLAAHIAPARAILAGMLHTIGDPDLQKTIHEALIADNFLVRGRNPEGWGIPSAPSGAGE